jgi:hypothetical protein
MKEACIEKIQGIVGAFQSVCPLSSLQILIPILHSYPRSPFPRQVLVLLTYDTVRWQLTSSDVKRLPRR